MGGVDGNAESGYVAEVEVRIDDEPVEIVKMPADFATRKYDVYWNYGLDGKPHKLKFTLMNPNEENTVVIRYVFEQVAE